MRKTILTFALLAAAVMGANLQARTLLEPVSQLAVIVPPQENRDPALGPRLCLKFSLPQEVQNFEIGAALVEISLRLPVLSDDSLAIFEAFGLMSSWGEGQGWADFPVFGGDLDSSLYSSATTRCERDSIITFDVTEMVRQWISNPEANFGLILIPRATDWHALRTTRFVPEQIRSRINLKVVVPGRAEQ